MFFNSYAEKEFADRAGGERCIGTRAGTPFAKLHTVFFVTSENSLLSALVTKNTVRNLAKDIPALVPMHRSPLARAANSALEQETHRSVA